MRVDVAFDVRSDADGRDPDKYSPMLRRFHKTLWSKPLPDGRLLEWHEDPSAHGLYHRSNEIGEVFVRSDTMMPTWQNGVAEPLFRRLPEQLQTKLDTAGYTIGDFIVFPGRQVDRKQTINQARGCRPQIADRFDLTLECIRRHYQREDSPLGDVLERYHAFFELFRSFREYVQFFLLDDLMTNKGDVDFLLPFENFDAAAVPPDFETYKQFLDRTLAFMEARNRRIRTLHG